MSRTERMVWLVMAAMAGTALALSSGCRIKTDNGCPDGVCPQPNGTTEHRAVPAREVPVMNLPEHARCRNYNGGSCVCASTISALRWQGQDELADKVRQACSGGQSAGSLHEKLERLGIRYAYTTSGDVKFLEWCIRTRRGCGITFFSNHFINLVHLDGQRAILMDNNHPKDFITLERDEFIRRWRGHGGWATALVYQPPPPPAFVAQR